MAGVGPSADAGVGGEAMESILVGGERAKNGGDADEARSAAAAAWRASKDKPSINMLTDGVS